jgi:hypothetical protein
MQLRNAINPMQTLTQSRGRTICFESVPEIQRLMLSGSSVNFKTVLKLFSLLVSVVDLDPVES